MRDAFQIREEIESIIYSGLSWSDPMEPPYETHALIQEQKL